MHQVALLLSSVTYVLSYLN